MSDIEKYSDEPARTAREIKLPLTKLTRVQRRYALEPWFTAMMVTGGVLFLLCEVLGFWLPWHWQFIWTGIMFLLVGVGGAVAKGFHWELNTNSEGSIEAPPSRGVRGDW